MRALIRGLTFGSVALAVLCALMLLETSLVDSLIRADQPPSPSIIETVSLPTIVDDLECVAVKNTIVVDWTGGPHDGEKKLELETEDGRKFKVAFPIGARRVLVGKNNLSALVCSWLPGTAVVYCDKVRGLSIASVDKNGAIELVISFTGELKEGVVNKAVIAAMLGGESLDRFFHTHLGM